MPSDARNAASRHDDRLRQILALAAPAMREYRSAVADTLEEVRGWRAQREEAVADPIGRLTRELGTFATGRLDPVRLAGLLAVEEGPDPLTHHLMEEAYTLFQSIQEESDSAFVVTVPSGGDLRDVVRDRLAKLGRAFGTAHAVEQAQRHSYDPDTDHVLLHDYPFHQWSLLEKEVAPALVVKVDAADLRAPGLSEFLEGSQKLILVVSGSAAPAPLARLVLPGVYVAQATGEVAGLRIQELAALEGAGVVAVFEDDASILPFVQRPGSALEVDAGALAEWIETVSAKRGQPGILDLRHLDSLGGMMGGGDEAPKPKQASVDTLAAWLLGKTDLSDGGPSGAPEGA